MSKCKCKKDECVNPITGNVLNTSNVFTYLTCRLKTHQKSGVYTFPLYENKKYLKCKTKKKLKCKTLLLCECILLLSVKHPHGANAKNSVHSTFLHSAFQKPHAPHKIKCSCKKNCSTFFHFRFRFLQEHFNLCGASHHLKPFCFFCHLKEPFLNLLFIGSKLYYSDTILYLGVDQKFVSGS
jgi:hypothetical protein